MRQGVLDLITPVSRAAATKRPSIWSLKPVEHLHIPQDMRNLISKLMPDHGTKVTSQAIHRTCVATAQGALQVLGVAPPAADC